MSVLRDCLSARRRSGGMLTCERVNTAVGVSLSPRVISWCFWEATRGFLLHLRLLPAAIGVALS